MQKKIIALLSYHKANIKKSKVIHLSFTCTACSDIIIYLYGFDSSAKWCYFIMWFNYLRILFKVCIYSFVTEPQKKYSKLKRN